MQWLPRLAFATPQPWSSVCSFPTPRYRHRSHCADAVVHTSRAMHYDVVLQLNVPSIHNARTTLARLSHPSYKERKTKPRHGNNKHAETPRAWPCRSQVASERMELLDGTIHGLHGPCEYRASVPRSHPAQRRHSGGTAAAPDPPHASALPFRQASHQESCSR